MSPFVAYGLTYLLGAGWPLAVGMWMRRTEALERWSWAGLGVPVLAAVALAATGVVGGVGAEHVLGGLVLAAMMAGIPATLLFVLGRLARTRWVPAVVCTLLLVPGYGYVLLGVIAVASLTSCPPGSYECPV